jgi:putative ATP-dependent endonuclease of OLD family
MYLEKIRIWNWRKFELSDHQKPSIEIEFNKHLNVLVGENDSGKTAIIDAIRAGLGTNSQDTNWIFEEDYFDVSNPIKVEYFYKEMSEEEEAYLYEWLYFDNKESVFRVVLEAEIIKDINGKKRISKSLVAGEEGRELAISDDVKHLLSVTYLKPLRDAEAELSPGNRSRFAQILKNLNVFYEDEEKMKKDIEEILSTAFSDVQKKIDIPVLSKMEGVVNSFFDKSRDRKPEIQPKGMKLEEFLKKLQLSLGEIGTGLGSSNLLFMAAELLLLSENKFGPQLALIEEIEAHIHPQSQLRLIKYFERKSKEDGIQYILTSHSPILAASISLEHIILIFNNQAFSMGVGKTLLKKHDYKFLERFLDATKSNMFFAKGIILVEGDAENLLIPSIAEIIGRPLYDYGVSIVNVGNLAFKSYESIFLRSSGALLNFPVSIVTDLDLKPISYFEDEDISYFEIDLPIEKKIGDFLGLDLTDSLLGNYYTFEILIKKLKAKKINIDVQKYTELKEIVKIHKNKKYDEIVKDRQTQLEVRYFHKKENVKVFVSIPWTLEFAILESQLSDSIQDAILETQYKLPSNRRKVKEKWAKIQSKEKRATSMYRFMLDNEISKPVVAQVLAQKLIDKQSTVKAILENDPKLKYLYDSILHVTGGM